MKKVLAATAFQAGFILSIAAWAPVVLALFWLRPLPRYRVIRQWGRFNLWWVKVTCGLSYEIAGRENIPSTPCVILSKHQSTWETLAFQWILPPHVWVLKRELLWIPLLGWGMALSKPIAIARDQRRKAIDQVVRGGRERLASGRYVIIFPEGTRVPAGHHGRFKQGGARLAIAAGCPVVPIAHNAGCFWGRRRFIKEPGVVRVVVGPPISPEGIDAATLSARAEAWIKETTTALEKREPACPKGARARAGHG
ncbi:1-acyl-sn-glycerol-3-phosphate acyltransferase [Acidiferrobacter sp.]|uniref:lysophospholipid acyltransferase family protein n=1 Tax=Acidiferrobacter sp. TaxID=1872107 RepID=UPI002636253D|nr:lysophospholipid acyltransferase family protein [Acidiferrobacter sp.]